MDTDSDGQIDFEEFMAAAGIKKEEVDYEKNIHKMPGVYACERGIERARERERPCVIMCVRVCVPVCMRLRVRVRVCF